MDDPVADVLAQRARMDSGAAAAVALSLFAHGALSALAIWAAWHHTAPQTPFVMNIRFAKPAPVPVAAAPAIAKPAPVPAPVVSKPAEAPKPVAKPVQPSPFGKSTKKATPPASAPAPAVAPTTTQPEIAVGTAAVTALEGGDFPYTVYIDRMNTLIGTRWLRPQAVEPGTSTKVYFVIERDGTIRDASIETASRNGTFDRAALRAVLESSPLPPLPFGYSGTYLGVHLTFR